MYISMQHLTKLCQEEAYKLIHAETCYGLTGWHILRNALLPYSVHLLYIAESTKDLKDADMPVGMHLLLFLPKDTELEEAALHIPEHVTALLVATDTPHACLTRISDFFEHTIATGLFSHSLLQTLSFGGGIQEMVNHALQILKNPIFVFDSGFKLIAANWEEAEKHAIPTETTLIQNMGFSKFEFSLLNKERIHDRIKKSDTPIRITHKELGYEQMVVAIDTMRDLGHIVIDALNRPFTAMDEHALWVLKEHICQQMRKDEFIQNSKGFAYENFLRDLLDEKLAVNKSLLNRMQYVGIAFTGNMHCIVVEIARSSCAVNPYRIRNEFDGQFSNCKTLIYKGQLIILLSNEKERLLSPEQIQTASDICSSNNLYAGMSNCFTDILSFSEYYKQALRAIELGISEKTQPTLFLYKDFYFEHIKNIFLQKESAKTFCHPKMDLLLRYDQKHHSDFAHTFYMYLLHERNIGATADAMNMHRSSLTYRLKKIYALVGEDFDDVKERQYLILSYELCKNDVLP